MLKFQLMHLKFSENLEGKKRRIKLVTLKDNEIIFFWGIRGKSKRNKSTDELEDQSETKLENPCQTRN